MPAKTTGMTVTLKLEGVDETLKAFKALPREASNALREEAGSIATGMALLIHGAGQARGGQAALVASTVKIRRDRVPFVVVGGTKRLSAAKGKKDGTQKEAYRLLFGSEFGATKGASKTGPNGFSEHTGRKGAWIFPTIEEHQKDISAAWGRAADEIVVAFTKDA